MAEFTSLLCFALISLGALGSGDNELRIHNENEFITFLNSSSFYTGTTVYLESDLDFTGGLSSEFGPKNTFYGSFDGQGHIIGNFVVKSSSNKVGIFEILAGSIKNIVIDSSCSFTSNFTGNANVYVGIVARHYYSNNDNLISNIVNMANLAFEGNTTGNMGFLYIGGIVGNIHSDYDVTVKNCVNYGTITHSGITSATASIGGIIGHSTAVSTATSSPIIYIQNSLNYGTIIINGTPRNSYIGGIVGESMYIASLTNCVSAGIIISNTDSKGGIAGYASPTTNITHCLWTSDTNCSDAYKYTSNIIPSTINSSLATISSTTINELNEYARINYGWNKWIINTNNVSVTFKVNNDEMLILSSQLILLPDISDNGDYVFDGWYTDSYCNKPFESTEVTEETTLYGLYGAIVIVSFNANEGNAVVPSSKKVTVNSTYGTLPTPNRDGYTFDGWFNENNELIASDSTVVITSDHILTAQWIPNNYTATFDLGNGTEIEKDFRVDETITYPQYVAKEGHSLEGWSSDIAIVDGKMPASDVTFTAQWTPISYNATFKNGYDESDTTTKQVKCGEDIEYPTISREGYTLDKWTSDVAIVDGKMPASDVTFTAEWSPNNYTVIFDLGNGTKIENTLHFNDPVVHPENVMREGYSFNGWINDTEYMPAHNLTITAQWIPNNYTVTFNVSGGDELDIKEKTVIFNKIYGTLPTPNRTGYTFIGWFDKNNESVNDTTIVSIADNHTLIAQWTDNKNCVEIVFGTKDLTEEEIRVTIKQYTDNDNFEIVKIEESESGEMVVIIKFIDVTIAQEFVRKVKASDDNMIKRVEIVGFISENIKSLSPLFYPNTFFSFFNVII